MHAASAVPPSARVHTWGRREGGSQCRALAWFEKPLEQTLKLLSVSRLAERSTKSANSAMLRGCRFSSSCETQRGGDSGAIQQLQWLQKPGANSALTSSVDRPASLSFTAVLRRSLLMDPHTVI